MAVRSISHKLQEKAIRELNEDPIRTEECLQHLREWLKKQPHLNVRTEDQALMVFLRGCKWSVQRSKEKIDYFYTIRTLIPELFASRDLSSSIIQNMLKKGVFHPLASVKGTDRSRLCLLNLSAVDPSGMSLIDVLKAFFMGMEILLNEDDNFVIAGFELVVDYLNLPLNYLLQFTPTTLKKFVLCIQNAYPVRIKKVVAINCHSAVATMYNNILKPLLQTKLQHRVKVYSVQNIEKMYNDIPKYLLPVEYGGETGSVSVFAEQWKHTVESYRHWFLEDRKYVCNEHLRPGTSKTYNEEFGMEGTFRKLVID